MCLDEQSVSVEAPSLAYNLLYRVIPIETGHRCLLLNEFR